MLAADESSRLSPDHLREARGKDAEKAPASPPTACARSWSSSAAAAWIRQTTPVATDDVEPFTTQLAPNYPNPFRKQTTIAFEVPTTQRTTLTVYDVLGREVAVLVEGLMPAGTHRVRFDGRTLAPGVYFYQIRTNAFVETREMIVVR